MRNVAGQQQGMLYSYDGRFWDVPKNFQFPVSIKRDVGWKLWLDGMPGYSAVVSGEVIEQPIKAFRKFVLSRLPKKIRDTFKLHWKPLYILMESGVVINGIIPDMPNDESVMNLYNLGTEHLQRRVSYVFNDCKLHHDNWTIATWSKYIARNMIMQRETDEDKRNLPEETRYNQGHQGRKRRVTRREQTRVDRQVPVRVDQHEEVGFPASNSDNNDQDPRAGAELLPAVDIAGDESGQAGQEQNPDDNNEVIQTILQLRRIG